MSLADILPIRSHALHALTRGLWHLHSQFRSCIVASVIRPFALSVTGWLTARLLLVASVSLRWQARNMNLDEYLACYEVTEDANSPLTARDIRQMWSA